MGVIARQSTKKTIVSFAGVLIGAISILFIYPYDKEIYGLALFLFSSSNLLMVLLSLGSHGLILKYYPVFQRQKIKGFLSLIFLIVFVSVCFTSLLLLVLQPFFFYVLELLTFNVELIREHAITIYILTILLVFIQIFIYHSSNLKRIVIPSLLFDLGYKIVLPLLVLLSFMSIVTTPTFIALYILFFALVLVFLFLYVASLGGLKTGKLSLSSIKPTLRKEMFSYMMFSGMNQIGTNIVARVDTIMVATLISLTDTGIYGILLFMANVIDIPVRSINQIAGPIISSSMEYDDKENISRIYTKSSINALVIGIFLFILIWALLNNIFQLMPDNDQFYEYKNVFLFLALGKLVDIGFSTNTFIIIYSRFYRFNLIFVLFLGILNLILNYVFIREFGLTGAALATAISLVIYNIIKLIFIKIKLDYWPFTLNTLRLILIGIISFLGCLLLPDIFLNWLDILIKGVLVTIFYYVLLKIFGLKADVISMVENFSINKIKKLF